MNNKNSQVAKSAYADYLAGFVASAYIDELGNYEKAVETYDEALALDPDNTQIAAQRARALSLRFISKEPPVLLKVISVNQSPSEPSHACRQ